MRIVNHTNLSLAALDAVVRLLPAWGTLQEVVVGGRRSGWQPTPSLLRRGDRVLGHAACQLH